MPASGNDAPPRGDSRLVQKAYPVADIRAIELIERITSDQAPGTAIARASCASWADCEALGIVDALHRDILHIGHRLQLLLHRSVFATPNDPRLIRLGALGAEVRVTHRSLPDMLVFGAEVFTVAHRDQDQRQVVHVRSQELSTSLLHLFGGLWDHAEDIASARRAEDSIQATVLSYLYAGTLDDAAAREMGISVRTYRRYVARVLRDLNVTSRFQAGVKAANLKLLSGL
jgi:DNA-binding CsgD family transcriptional regulator